MGHLNKHWWLVTILLALLEILVSLTCNTTQRNDIIGINKYRIRQERDTYREIPTRIDSSPRLNKEITKWHLQVTNRDMWLVWCEHKASQMSWPHALINQCIGNYPLNSWDDKVGWFFTIMSLGANARHGTVMKYERSQYNIFCSLVVGRKYMLSKHNHRPTTQILIGRIRPKTTVEREWPILSL